MKAKSEKSNKKIIIFLIPLAIVLVLLLLFIFLRPNTNKSTDLSRGALSGNSGSWQKGMMQGGRGMNQNINKGNCIGDDCLEVSDLNYPAGELTKEAQNAVNEAINDEYKAYSTYRAVIEKFGMTRPFSMIIRAEEQHISSLKAIYDKYGLTAPENTITNVIVPPTITQACQIGVDAEIANAALYKDKLLPAVVDYPDITNVFTNLMNASQDKHLPAFNRCN